MRKNRLLPAGIGLLVAAVAALIAATAIPPELHAPIAYAQQKGEQKKAQRGNELPSPTTDDATNSLFTTATTCALCHTTASRSSALVAADGQDVSPDHTWRATMMANSFRDPYWRAKVEHELSAAPADEHAAIEEFCLGCHGPMAVRSATLLKTDMPSVAEAADDPLAADGVSCTLCHQIRDEDLGDADSFTAGFVIAPGKTAYGPYADPFSMPMLRHSGFQAEHSPHIGRSAVCGTCHTFFTHAGGDAPAFPEQAPYLEWRNSIYNDENGTTATSRSCPDCHMADVGSMRIAHNPAGRDFPRTGTRDNVRSHGIVGGNAFMIEILEDNWEALSVVADADQVDAALVATRATLREAATLTISDPVRQDDELVFDVTVTNLTGHKLPSSYPSRRAWLRVQVVAGGRVVFDSGAYDEDGHIVGPTDESDVAHTDVIASESDVVIYEARPVDGNGDPTLFLRKMQAYGKDTRLLPKGWSKTGPDAALTRPVGVTGDTDFTAGRDTVTYRVPLSAGRGGLTVHAWLLYQTVPPAWIEPLRDLGTPYAEAFVDMYDDADKTPEVLAEASVRK